MKKILALILAMVMVFALAACGSNETGTSATPNTENTQQTETPEKEMTPDELQKYYEGYFASEDVGFAGECITAEGDGMKIIVSTNKDASVFVKALPCKPSPLAVISGEYIPTPNESPSRGSLSRPT